jgi:chromate transporter
MEMSRAVVNAAKQTKAMPDSETWTPHRVSLIDLFLLFSKLGLSSFGGGVSAWMHRAFVEQRGWLSEQEFSAALALGRIMPGANVVNLAVLIGQRARGALGAVAAATGLLIGPSLAVIGLTIGYGHFAGSIVLRAVLEGTAAAAAGLLIGMGVVSGSRIINREVKSRGRALQSVSAMAVMAGMFFSIGVLRFPTVPTVLCLAPFSIALALFTARNSSAENRNE